MSTRMGLARTALALAMVLGSSVLLPTKTVGQDTADSLKRRVKSKVIPDYPLIAKQLNLQGKVRIEATISADGHVTNTRIVGGNPVLANAAQDALKKWRFESAPRDTTEIIEIDFSGKS